MCPLISYIAKDDSRVYYPSVLISLKDLVQERDCQVISYLHEQGPDELLR